MKQKIVVMSAAVCFFVGLETVRAAGFTNIDFYQDATIQAGDSYGNVGVYDTPPGHTTLTITGGTVYNLLSYDASTVNMSDGLVEALGAFEQSTVNMSGGYVSTFHAYDDSAVNMSGGDVYSLKAWEYSIIDFDINAKAFSLGAREHGTVNIKGGITEYLRAGDYGVVNISGGEVFDSINAGIDGNIFFYGSDLIKSDIGGNKGYGFISGKWLNGADFTIDIGTYETYSQVVLVPEPFTILFFIGGIFLFQKRKH